MKAIMSNTLREILRDPQKRKQLDQGMSQLRHKNATSEDNPVNIGGKEYIIKFVSPHTKE